MEAEAFQFIDNSFGANTNFIAIHLRMGSDWVRCELGGYGLLQHRILKRASKFKFALGVELLSLHLVRCGYIF